MMKHVGTYEIVALWFADEWWAGLAIPSEIRETANLGLSRFSFEPAGSCVPQPQGEESSRTTGLDAGVVLI